MNTLQWKRKQISTLIQPVSGAEGALKVLIIIYQAEQVYSSFTYESIFLVTRFLWE